jgi:hypothetical protein
MLIPVSARRMLTQAITVLPEYLFHVVEIMLHTSLLIQDFHTIDNTPRRPRTTRTFKTYQMKRKRHQHEAHAPPSSRESPHFSHRVHLRRGQRRGSAQVPWPLSDCPRHSHRGPPKRQPGHPLVRPTLAQPAHPIGHTGGAARGGLGHATTGDDALPLCSTHADAHAQVDTLASSPASARVLHARPLAAPFASATRTTHRRLDASHNLSHLEQQCPRRNHTHFAPTL